ncbi:facilitated trehalose transporter Tret1-like [Hyposmocoma kahamanoa]|uniref:facilitated trehalose transporter Tret1-like n=1 Tax=Hyposmocoma kahamanoa TaxID=1477025 RepID=UPI000E6D90D2|nr:facilitated trehalose transporter Tret1-like [Hyposmocoma kahamanoa]
MVIIGAGMAFGFSAVTLPALKGDETIETPTEYEKAWIASVINLTAPLGCIICGWIMDKCGRKPALVCSQVPMIIGWLYTWRATAPKDIILGRTIAGIGCGMATSAPRPYITEITLPNMRATVGVLITLGISLGLTIEAALGSVLKWRILSLIGGIYSLIFLVANIFLPETPYYVLMTSTMAKARITLQKFRGPNYNINKEMESLLYFRDMNQIRRLTTKELFRSLFKPAACKPFWIVFPYIIFAQFSGITILFFYTIEILKECRSSVDPHAGNIALGATRSIISILTSIILFKIKRRPLAILSALGVAVTCILLSIYLLYSTKESVVPQLALIIYVAFGTIGYYSLPILIAFELIPLQFRGLLGGIMIAVTNLIMFVCIQSFPFMKRALTLPYTILLFGIFSILGAVFISIVLPETRHLTLYQIEQFYKKPLPTALAPSSAILTSSEYGIFQTIINVFAKLKRNKTIKDLPNITLQRHFKDSVPNVTKVPTNGPRINEQE